VDLSTGPSAIALIGFMGAGKTTVGRLLADRLGLAFVDTDRFIEECAGRSVRGIFDEDGEPHFRALEHQAVATLVGRGAAVIALGGGAVEDPRTRSVLGAAEVIYLQVDYAEALARVDSDAGRPMLHRPGLDDLYRRRMPIYAEVADITVSTGHRRPETVATDIVRELQLRARLPR
jgi:shikimate kinase/3-dehydroquinate synthase